MVPPTRWHRLWQEARRTPSPNGGWPMGAMALQLDLRLGKPGVYLLNEAGREPAAADVARAVGRARASLGLGALLLMTLALTLRGGVTW